MIGESALQKLSHLNKNGKNEWYALIRNIFEGKPIGIDISFPPSDSPNDQIEFLYRELKKVEIHEEVFELAYLKVFDFYRKNDSYNEQLYWVIYVFDEISFGHYFSKFKTILVHEELILKSHLGINLHYLLFNLIMDNDDKRELKKYLLKKSKTHQSFLFHQTAIRYFGDYLLSEDFIALMNNIVVHISPFEINDIVNVFDELVEFNSIEYIQNWFRDPLFEENSRIGPNEKIYNTLYRETFSWLRKIHEQNVDYFDEDCLNLMLSLGAILKVAPETNFGYQLPNY